MVCEPQSVDPQHRKYGTPPPPRLHYQLQSFSSSSSPFPSPSLFLIVFSSPIKPYYQMLRDLRVDIYLFLRVREAGGGVPTVDGEPLSLLPGQFVILQQQLGKQNH